MRFLPQGRVPHAKEGGIEAIKAQHYPRLRLATMTDQKRLLFGSYGGPAVAPLRGVFSPWLNPSALTASPIPLPPAGPTRSKAFSHFHTPAIAARCLQFARRPGSGDQHVPWVADQFAASANPFRKSRTQGGPPLMIPPPATIQFTTSVPSFESRSTARSAPASLRSASPPALP